MVIRSASTKDTEIHCENRIYFCGICILICTVQFLFLENVFLKKRNNILAMKKHLLKHNCCSDYNVHSHSFRKQFDPLWLYIYERFYLKKHFKNGIDSVIHPIDTFESIKYKDSLLKPQQHV